MQFSISYTIYYNLQITVENNWKQICDIEEINKICVDIMLENPKAVKDYHKGKVQAIKFLTGQIAKKTDHLVNFNIALKKLEELLKN